MIIINMFLKCISYISFINCDKLLSKKAKGDSWHTELNKAKGKQKPVQL